MGSVFISKSGKIDENFVRALEESLEGKLSCLSEDDFRPWEATTSYYEAWAHQFDHTRRASVMLVLLTGKERDQNGNRALSHGQIVEALDAIWRGIPVIWCGTTSEGKRTASGWHSTMKRNHPCIVSHEFDVLRNNQDRLHLLSQLCLRLSTRPRTHLPDEFRVHTPQRLRYQVCEATSDGWQPKDLSAEWFRPVLRVSYGEHMLQPPFGRRMNSPFRSYMLDMKITDPLSGLIEGDIPLDSEGVGHFTMRWVPTSNWSEDNDELPWGEQLLQWDFVCYD